MTAWHKFLVTLGIRKPSFTEQLAHELDEACSQLLLSKKQAEMWKASTAMYSERVKRLKRELAEEISETGDPVA